MHELTNEELLAMIDEAREPPEPDPVQWDLLRRWNVWRQSRGERIPRSAVRVEIGGTRRG